MNLAILGLLVRHRLVSRIAVAATLTVGTVVTAGAPASAVSCSTVDSISEFRGLGSAGCVIGDKKFTFVDSDLDLTPPASDFAIQFLQGGLSYSFIGDGNLTGTGNFLADNEFVSYTVEVIVPGAQITQVRLDSAVSVSEDGGDATTVTKSIFASIGGNLLDTLLSTDGSTDTSVALANSLLFIQDDIHVALNDTLSSFTNTIVQTQVPSPARSRSSASACSASVPRGACCAAPEQRVLQSVVDGRPAGRPFPLGVSP